MRRVTRASQRRGRWALAWADRACNALYTWRYNPIYHSGALVVASFAVLLVTGLYLLLFYRIGAPYESVSRITDQVFLGRWIRTLHRYVSDLAVVAIVVHAFRMFVQDRAWGTRALAWVSGVVLTLVFLVCGWTGYVMVWDVQGQLIALEGARLFDFLPIFSEPISRTFVGDQPMPSAFFFMNLFAHIAFPVGIALLLWVHVARLARPVIWPPKPLLWGTVWLFTALSVVWPVAMAEEADLLRLPGGVPFDAFYVFLWPLTRALPPGAAWLVLLGISAAALAVPLLVRPGPEEVRQPSWVNPRVCTGCEQCYHDCPWEAISMVRRDDGRDGYVGLVDPALCVSCGICAGSCAPMVVGPPGRTGRDQLAAVKAFIAEERLSADHVVVVGCEHSAAGRLAHSPRAPVFPVPCVGAVHTSVLEYLVRAGAGGVLVAACPGRDCPNREGVKWLLERVYGQREAELKERVDRRRLRVVQLSELEAAALQGEITSFRERVGALGPEAAEQEIDLVALCEVPAVSVAEGEDR